MRSNLNGKVCLYFLSKGFYLLQIQYEHIAKFTPNHADCQSCYWQSLFLLQIKTEENDICKSKCPFINALLGIWRWFFCHTFYWSQEKQRINWICFSYCNKIKLLLRLNSKLVLISAQKQTIIHLYFFLYLVINHKLMATHTKWSDGLQYFSSGDPHSFILGVTRWLLHCPFREQRQSHNVRPGFKLLCKHFLFVSTL